MMLFFENWLGDGRYLVVAVEPQPEGHGNVVTIGTGKTPAEARADCKNDLMALGYPEHEATVGQCLYKRPLQ